MTAVTASVSRGRARLADANLRTVIRAALLVGLLLYFTFATAGFWSTGNLYSLLQSYALLGLVAAGLSLTMISGEFDLSVGAMVAVSGIVAIKMGHDPWVGLAVAVGVGLAFGLVNGVLVVALRVSSLVVTVGMLVVLTGLAYKLADGKVVSYTNFGPGARLDQPIADVFSLRSLITIAVLVIAGLILRFTQLGRDIRAAGSARQASVAAGVRANRALVIVFVIAGGLSALAGALLAFSLASASPTSGGDLLLQSASAAIVGGVALVGGVGSAGGVATGVMILTVLNNGLSLVGASSATVSIGNGIILLGVVLLDAARVGRLSDLLVRRPAPAPSGPSG